ncbi:MAG: DUF6273 domain-containing protein [Eubacterium sp.]|nr:DUF6273 domain-containing protein [Eubacterium sp.]
MASGERRQNRARKKLMNRTPQERYTWLLALREGTGCILQIEDKYRVYRRMEAEFGDLADMEPEEAGDFQYQEECATYRDECKTIADEMEKELPEEVEIHSRTEMMSAGQRQQHDKESGNNKPGIARWILLGILVLGIALAVCRKIPVTRGLIGEVEDFIGMKSLAIKSFRVSGEENGGWDKALATEKKVIASAAIGKKVKFGKLDWVVLDHKEDRTLLIAREPMKERKYHKTNEAVTWSGSSLRAFLNGKYLDRNFFPKETDAIVETDLPVTENESYDTKDDPTTMDKVFIASTEDVDTYEEALGDMVKHMRLRTPGMTQDTTAFVSVLGTVIDNGFPVNEEGAYVRPMIWVNTK